MLIFHKIAERTLIAYLYQPQHIGFLLLRYFSVYRTYCETLWKNCLPPGGVGFRTPNNSSCREWTATKRYRSGVERTNMRRSRNKKLWLWNRFIECH